MTTDEKSKLDIVITTEELNKVVKTLKPGKSPGDDGLTAEWYHNFWYLIKENFKDLVSEILEQNTLTNSQYRGVISLLYKNGDRELLRN